LIVPDVDQWCINHNIIDSKEYYPFRVARHLYSNEKDQHLILFAKEITQGMMDSVISLVIIRLGNEHQDIIKDELSFIKHTTLHEIAHAKGIFDELEADKWAMQQLLLAET
jgi:hypothetical protein